MNDNLACDTGSDKGDNDDTLDVVDAGAGADVSADADADVSDAYHCTLARNDEPDGGMVLQPNHHFSVRRLVRLMNP